MRIRHSDNGHNHPLGSEITPASAHHNRRQIMQHLATGVAGAALASWASRQALAQSDKALARPGKLAPLASRPSTVAGANTMEKPTTYADASTYNNFYEFGTDKADPAKNAHSLKTRPWSVEIEGLVKKPGRWDIEDLLKLSAMEERIYRMRCVEGWSMVIPWVGVTPCLS